MHAVLLAGILSVVRTAIPASPPEPVTVRMEFLAPPAPAALEAPAEPEQPPLEAAPIAEPARPPVSVPLPEPSQPVRQEPVQPPLPLPEPAPPVAQQPIVPAPSPAPARTQAEPKSMRHPAPSEPKRIVPMPSRLGPPANPAPAAEAAATLPVPAHIGVPNPEEAHTAPVDGSWMHAVGAWLAAHKSYPEEARQRGEEGRLAVRFTMDRSGQVTAAQVVRGSGSEALDRAALTMLKDARLPPLPDAMPQPTITVTVQIRFALGP